MAPLAWVASFFPLALFCAWVVFGEPKAFVKRNEGGLIKLELQSLHFTFGPILDLSTLGHRGNARMLCSTVPEQDAHLRPRAGPDYFVCGLCLPCVRLFCLCASFLI